MPRILLDLRPLQNGYAGHGIGRYARELTRALLALRDEAGENFGFSLEALVMGQNRNTALKSRNDLFPTLPLGLICPPWKRIWLWDQAVLGAHLARRRWDILHSFVALGPLAQISLPWLGAPHSVATVHDLHLFSPQAEPVLQAYRKTWRIRLQEKAICRAGAIVVDASPVKAELRARFHPQADIHVLNPGVDHIIRGLDGRMPQAEATPPDARDPSESPYVLALGDTANKGLAFAAEVVSLARGEGEKLRLRIIGDPAKVAACLGRWKDAPFIDLASAPDDKALVRHYRGAVALLFPSEREGFGFPILEAQALGCPALVLDKAPMKDLVAWPKHALPAHEPWTWTQALLNLCHSQEWRVRCSEEGKIFSEEFTWKRAALALMEIWKESPFR